jgi:hypothetical protein
MYRLWPGSREPRPRSGVTGPIGRSGAAIADGGGDPLVIDPHTGSLLDSTTNPVHAHARILARQIQLTLVRPRLLRQRRSPGVGPVRPLASTWLGMRP